MPRRLCWILLLFATHLLANSLAQQNITIDDNNPAIVYSSGVNASWGVPPPSTMDEGGTHHLSSDVNAFATFTFTGVAVYFMSPLWPYLVYTQVRLDSQTAVQLNLTDPNPIPPLPGNGDETTRSAVVWSSQNLSNTTHTLIISKVPLPDHPYAIVDAIIYTVLESPSSSSFKPPVSSTSSSSSIPSISVNNSPSNDTSSSSNNVLAIALGAALGALGSLVIAMALWLLCCRRNKHPESNTWSGTGASMIPVSASAAPLPPNHPTTQSESMYNLNAYQQPYGVNPSQNVSWSASNPSPQMSNVGVLGMTNATQPDSYSGYASHVQQESELYNPRTGSHQQLQGPRTPQQHALQQSPYYEATTLSTITENSTPGTLNSNRIHLGAYSPATYPSADLSYYTPPTGVGPGGRSSYMSNLSTGPASSTYKNQHSLYPSGSTELRDSYPSSSTLGNSGTPVKLSAQQGLPAPMIRGKTESEKPSPPTYSL